MSEANGKTGREKSADRRSNVSGDTHRTRRSHRSRSRERDRDRERRRHHDSRRGSRDGLHRDRDREHHHRHRSRETSDRDRHRHRDRHADRDRDREGTRARDKDDRDRKDRRRGRDEDLEDEAYRERVKRRREEDGSLRGDPSPQNQGGSKRESHGPIDRSPSILGRIIRSGDDELRNRSPGLEDPLDRPINRRPSPRREKRQSPTYEPPSAIADGEPELRQEDDSEARSVFVSQLAARLTARDLGYFFEDKLGEGSVRDCRIVTDRISRRSKGIAYVEFRSIDLVPKAIALSGTIVMGLPIMIQLTEAERNRTHAADMVHSGGSGARGSMQLYVGSLHFNLTESDIRQVFEPFGDIDFVDLHRDPLTGRSKGYAFVQYKKPEDAKMALEQMEGFELAGRALRVNTVHEKGTVGRAPQDSLEENGGTNLNAASRQALMQKLARMDAEPSLPEITRPNIPQAMTTKCVLLKNMFNPEEESDPNWDKDLGEEVRKECETTYGKVIALKVEPHSAGEIYIRFDAVDVASKAIQGLNGRYFGGNPISASFISDAIMQAHQ